MYYKPDCTSTSVLRSRTFLMKIARRAEGRPLDFPPIRKIGNRRRQARYDNFIVRGAMKIFNELPPARSTVDEGRARGK